MYFVSSFKIIWVCTCCMWSSVMQGIKQWRWGIKKFESNDRKLGNLPSTYPNRVTTLSDFSIIDCCFCLKPPLFVQAFSNCRHGMSLEFISIGRLWSTNYWAESPRLICFGPTTGSAPAFLGLKRLVDQYKFSTSSANSLLLCLPKKGSEFDALGSRYNLHYF